MLILRERVWVYVRLLYKQSVLKELKTEQRKWTVMDVCVKEDRSAGAAEIN